jgi:hypothetical protein
VSKREKLLQKLLLFPSEMRYADVAKLLEQHGFLFSHAGKNHNIFTDGTDFINVPTVKGKFVKRFYLLRIAEVLGYKGD